MKEIVFKVRKHVMQQIGVRNSACFDGVIKAFLTGFSVKWYYVTTNAFKG